MAQSNVNAQIEFDGAYCMRLSGSPLLWGAAVHDGEFLHQAIRPIKNQLPRSVR